MQDSCPYGWWCAIKAPVAGIAMGLISDGNNYTVLQISKVWKTTLEIWTLRLQVLVTGLQPFRWISRSKGLLQKSLTEALAQAKKARFEILDVIEATIPEVRPELAPTAPKIDTIKIDVDKIKMSSVRVEKPSIRSSLKQALRLISTRR